jgi:hypothetical protein
MASALFFRGCAWRGNKLCQGGAGLTHIAVLLLIVELAAAGDGGNGGGGRARVGLLVVCKRRSQPRCMAKGRAGASRACTK